MLMYCPKCCPSGTETYTGIRGSVSHDYAPIAWEYEYDNPSEPHMPTKAIAIEPWGWKCENCGHFKKPRKSKRMKELGLC